MTGEKIMICTLFFLLDIKFTYFLYSDGWIQLNQLWSAMDDKACVKKKKKQAANLK